MTWRAFSARPYCLALSEWLEAHPGQLPTSELDALPAAAPVLAAAAAAAETFNIAAATTSAGEDAEQESPKKSAALPSSGLPPTPSPAKTPVASPAKSGGLFGRGLHSSTAQPFLSPKLPKISHKMC